MNSPSIAKSALLAALLLLAPAAAFGNSADSANIRVDTRGRNLVSLTVSPAPAPAPAALPGAPQMAALTVSANTVPSGGTKQFLAMALYDDGSSEDVTAQAYWSVGTNPPKGSSLFGGLFKAGNPVTESVVRMLASFGAGSNSRTGSSDVVILPGMTVRIEYTLQSVFLNSQWSLSAQAIVAGNSSPITSSDIRWDMDADGAFDDKIGTYITQSYSHKRSQLVAVQVVTSGGETATAAVFFTLGATPEGVPKVSDVADAFSNSLYKLQSGSMVSLPSLPSSTSKLAVVIHGLENDAKMPWVKSLCGAIENSPAGATVVAYDWALMADPSKFSNGQTALGDQSVPSEFLDLSNDLLAIRENGRVNGMLLAERLIREKLMGKISNSTVIHLIGHSAGGFVAGECATRLYKAGFSNLQVTMLDTPLPYKSHLNSGWRTERYISSWAGGRFETEPGTSNNLARFYNLGANVKGDKVETVTWQTSAGQSYLTNSQSTAAFLLTNYEAVPASGVSEGSNYHRLEIPNPVIKNGGSVNLPGGLLDRHSSAHDWYEWTVTGAVSNNGFTYSNLLGSTPFPSSTSVIPAPMMADTPQTAAIPPPPVDLDGFTYFGTASGAGGVHTLTENTDAGFWKTMAMPTGSETLRFRYQFTTPGDGDFLAVYWGEEAVLVMCPDTDSARAGFVEMEADVSRFGGQTGNLVFKLVSRGEVNAVAEIDQVQIVLSDDPDDDGLTNAQEATYGSNAHNDDTDGDGLSDFDEVTTHGTNPVMADSDGDMVPDQAELAASTNPLDKNSFLRPRMERGAGGQLELLWQGVSGRTYSVVRSLDLTGTSFDFIRTEVPGTGVDCKVTDPDTAVNPRAFYWVMPE